MGIAAQPAIPQHYESVTESRNVRKTIAVAGIGYVGLSNAVLLAQHNTVRALDISAERVQMLNDRKCPIVDPDLEAYLAEKGLNLTATVDPEEAFAGADYVIVATPTNYDPETNFSDTSSVEQVIRTVTSINPEATVVIKATIPVGYTASAREELGTQSVIFSPEFLREGQALHDNLHPSRIIVGEESTRARVFAELLREGAISKNVQVLFTSSSEAEAIKLFADTIIARQPKTVGVFRLVMKSRLDNFRPSSIQGIMKRLKAKGIEVVIFEPAMEEDNFFGSEVMRDLEAFKAHADVIVANRHSNELADVAAKVFTRDLFGTG